MYGEHPNADGTIQGAYQYRRNLLEQFNQYMPDWAAEQLREELIFANREINRLERERSYSDARNRTADYANPIHRNG